MEIYRLNAAEVSKKICARELKAEELTQIILERISKVEPEINAYITVCGEKALQQAKKVDEKIARREKVGRLAGIPIAVKDNISTEGIRTSCGSKILENYIPPYNATVVNRLLSEGAVIIGKANMDEFAMGTTTETSYFKPTRNPWDTSRVPGGSSGGSAAAIAAGEAFLALGSDTGGSIRCPASFCGVVGVKPTYGLVSRYGLVAYANSLEQIGPIARSTEDCALLMNVIAGHDLNDATSADVEPKEYDLDTNLNGFRVGIPKEMMGEGTDQNILKAIYNLAESLENLGMRCGEATLSTLEYALPAYYLVAMSEASSNLARFDGIRYGYRIDDEGLDWNKVYSVDRKTGFGAEVKRRIILGTYALSAGYYDKFFLKSLKTITLIKRDFEEAFRKFDVLLSPTMPLLPFKLGEKINDPIALYMCDIDTVPANLTGIPAITFPCDLRESLPIGAQLMAPPFREDLLFRITCALEKTGRLRFPKPNF